MSICTRCEKTVPEKKMAECHISPMGFIHHCFKCQRKGMEEKMNRKQLMKNINS